MSAASSGEKNVPGTLWATGRRKSPAARGMASSAATDPPPADWPKTVTRSGSPPKARMLSRTPPVGGGAVDLRETLHAQPVVERHHDDTAGGQPAAVELRKAGRADHVAAAGDPHQHRQAGPRGRIGRPDVDRKPVVARRLLREPVHPEQAGLRRRRAVRDRRPHPRPAAHRPRCGESERTDRRLGVRDAAENRQPRLPAAAQHPGRRTDLRLGRGPGRPGCGDDHDSFPPADRAWPGGGRRPAQRGGHPQHAPRGDPLTLRPTSRCTRSRPTDLRQCRLALRRRYARVSTDRQRPCLNRPSHPLGEALGSGGRRRWCSGGDRAGRPAATPTSGTNQQRDAAPSPAPLTLSSK